LKSKFQIDVNCGCFFQNLSMSLSVILNKNEKVKYYMKMKTYKL